MVNWANQVRNLCVCCDKPLLDNSYWICKRCGKPCQVKILKELEGGEKYKLLDVKSECCIADVENMRKSTCSDQCHDKLVEDLEKSFGKDKKVVDIVTGKTHRVPTKQIIENGLNQNDLYKYPEWLELN